MAASNVLSSLPWITDKAKFLSVLNSSFLYKDYLSGCVSSEIIDTVFSGINQLNYWKRKLGPSIDNRTVLMACLGPSGLFKPDIHLLYEQAELITGKTNITSVYYSENTNVVGLNFTSAEAAASVRQGVATVGEALVCHIEQLPPNTYEVRVLWAPAFCHISLITQLFATYMTGIDLSFEKVNVKEGHQLPSNIAAGRITLKDGISVDDLPHIAKLPDNSGRHVLIVLKDRPPLCLNCRVVGHVRKQCKQRLCKICKSRHSRDLPCSKPSYAKIINQSQPSPLMGFNCSVYSASTGTDVYELTNQQLPDLSLETDSSGTLPIGIEIISENDSRLTQTITGTAYPAINVSESMENSLVDEHFESIGDLSDSPFISHKFPHNKPDEDGNGEFKLVTRRVTRSMKKKARSLIVKNYDMMESVPLPVGSTFSALSDEVDMMDKGAIDKDEKTFSEYINMKGDGNDDAHASSSDISINHMIMAKDDTEYRVTLTSNFIAEGGFAGDTKMEKINSEINAVDSGERDSTVGQSCVTQKRSIKGNIGTGHTVKKSKQPSQDDYANEIMVTPVGKIINNGFDLREAQANMGITTFNTDQPVTSVTEVRNCRKVDSQDYTILNDNFARDMLVPMVIEDPVTFPVCIKCCYCFSVNTFTVEPRQSVKCRCCPKNFSYDPINSRLHMD